MCLQEDIKSLLQKSFKVLRMYEWLLDLYVLDFFVDNHWEKLPSTWQKSFENIDPRDMGRILSGTPTNIVLPLSFLALISTVNSLSIQRKRTIKSTACGSKPRLQNLFLKHVKLKKRHEVDLMADIVNETAVKNRCDAVVDFGSGLGHLVRMLAYKYELYAVGLECQSQLTEEARKLDLELEYTAGKHLSEENLNKLRRPYHLNITLQSESQLWQLSLPETVKTYGLIGLHPCGDLGPLLLRHFINSSQVKFICVVGCCYMKLSCDGKSPGYPMSGFVKKLDNHLSYASREIACHAVEVYCERLKKGNYEDLKVHAYRAALERILVEHDPKLRHAPVRSIKYCNTLTFEKYCQLAVERLNLSLATSPSTWSRGEADLQQWRRVVTLYTLRLTLAPLVETVVLLDRMHYILEHGFSCEIRPAFDPKISPRNHIIIATRC